MHWALFLALFFEAFDMEWIATKSHWLLQFGSHLSKWGMLQNCFVLERKRRVPNRYATLTKNVSGFPSSSLLIEVTPHQLATRGDPKAIQYSPGFVGGTQGGQRRFGRSIGIRR